MKRDGMTIMELLVGLMVTGLALSAGYAAFASIVDHRERAAGKSDVVARSSAIRATLESWLSGARVSGESGGPQFHGLDGVHEGTPDDELWFVTTAPTPLGTRETIVRLYIDRDEQTAEKGLSAAFLELRGPTSRRIEIDPRVAGLQARYLSSVLGEPRWLPSWISTTLLPDALELTLTAGPEDSLPRLLNRPLLITLGNAR